MEVLQQLNGPEGRDGWIEFFDRWRRSGKKFSAFCREEGVSYYKARYWKRRLETVRPGRPRSASSPMQEAGFAEVLMSAGDSQTNVHALTIDLPRGVRVSVGGGADLKALRLVLEVLGR